MAANGRLEWCGSLGQVEWFGAVMSPCYFETLSSTLLLAGTLITLLAQGSRLALIQQLRAQGRVRKGISGLNGSYIASTLFICGTHFLHFCVSVSILRSVPFHILYHAALAVTWATIISFALYTGRLAVSVDFRIVTIAATAIYCTSLYSFYRLYFDTHGVPLPYIKASIWTAMLQAVVAAVASWLGVRRAARSPTNAALQASLGYPSHATADGYHPLPAGEPEAGAASGSAAGAGGAAAKPPPPPGGAADDDGDGDKATWISLFVDACAYVWPERLGLQLRAVACLLLLVAMRVINLAVPILYKRVVDTLAEGSAAGGGGGHHPQQPQQGPHQGAGRGLGLDLGLGRLLWGAAAAAGGAGGAGGGAAAAGVAEGEEARMGFGRLVWPWVVLYLAAVFFQGGAGGGIVGFINNMRSFLWIPVSQDAYRRISLRVFDHVLNLDLTFHLRKKTGEVTRVVDRGTNAMQNILSTILFNVLPQMFDVLAAATYLAQALEPTIAIIVFVTVGSYIPLTIVITEWRGKLRREMNQTDQVKSGRATDALLNYETVKYFNNEDHESRQYAAAIDAYQAAEYRSMSSINVLNVVQSAIMFCGIASGLLVCAGGVSAHVLTVGDAVLFLSLMAQLYGPLNFFGSYYRTIQQYMIDMENLLELLDRRSVVQDSPTARDLVVTKGELAFDDVTFAYESGHPVLRNVSFRVPGGQTIAFVGATGSGKSTVTRLIFRFYDVTSGAVRVDGQDLRGVTQSSLRRAVGMVPQDTVLFNDTILHNIRYGNLAASDEQVYEAAKLACIHDTIVNRFPKGYETVVGERGLRLSGGEKQRVAFARALLKNPAMLVLDEATSALDTITEKKIQTALADLRSDRTTVIVAHRLSTIADANIIVVMALGRVAETGSHQELLDAGGLYAEMWARQAQTAHQYLQGEGEGLATSSAGPSSLRGSAVDLAGLAALGGNKAASSSSASGGSGSGGSGVVVTPPPLPPPPPAAPAPAALVADGASSPHQAAAAPGDDSPAPAAATATAAAAPAPAPGTASVVGGPAVAAAVLGVAPTDSVAAQEVGPVDPPGAPAVAEAEAPPGQQGSAEGDAVVDARGAGSGLGAAVVAPTSSGAQGRGSGQQAAGATGGRGGGGGGGRGGGGKRKGRK